MKRLILTLAAALTLGGAAAHAQPAGTRTVETRTTVFHRSHHHGWNNHRGWDHNRGWSRSRRWHGHGQSCRTIWRDHTRTRTCRSW
ncbi:MAG TPA: hypothetical protein VH331_17715 [Allosphingosinicella sp.]|jgi:Ni/Co efflux regulator RcnB|nr:hypothetical protein [Allosphingosinicella sp.]